jgi:hypothetical protein
MPKEIMTLVDRPLVQYAIDKAPELERSLRNKGKAVVGALVLNR